MSNADEFGYMVKLLQGSEPLVKAKNCRPHYDGLGFLYFSIALQNLEERERLMDEIGGEAYKRGAERGYRELVPVLLLMLKNEPVIYGVDAYVDFILDGAEVTGVPLEAYVSRKELGEVRRTALLRSAKAKGAGAMAGKQDALLLVVSALRANISPTDFGFTQESAECCVRMYFGVCEEESDKPEWAGGLDERAMKLNAL